MKRISLFFGIILMNMSGCGGLKQSTDDLITIDVTKSYPNKELILQDFMDVEYIALETNDEFINQGIVIAVGKQIIVVKNIIRDGDMFVYDRNGKALRKINRMGQGGEEYVNINSLTLDEDNEEMFVNDAKKILVYDLYGKFKRSFPSSYGYLYNLDRESFICHNKSFDVNVNETDKPPFLIISKKDGSITKEIQPVCQQKRPSSVSIQRNDMTVVAFTSNFPYNAIIPWHESWILTVYSNDTIYQYLSDHSLTPFLARTPSIQSTNPEAFMSIGLLTERYWFLQTEKIEADIAGNTPATASVFFPTTHILYDRQEKDIYKYTVYNGDFSTQKPVKMSRAPSNSTIAFYQKIETHELVEAYTKGELKGKLKEIAAKLDAEDNPVIMLVKHKK